jgi:hypothetical protein
MLLPLLLRRDFGVGGWWAFAVPNIVGAAAMGVILSAAASRRVTDRHRWGLGLFSDVTLWFHATVLVGVLPLLLPAGPYGAAAGVAVTAAAVTLWACRGEPRLAVPLPPEGRQPDAGAGARAGAGWGLAVLPWVLMVVAVLVAGWWASRGLLWSEGPEPRVGRPGLWWFAVAALLGFALCPYMDATFHRARQALPGGAGAWAFVLGFGVVFGGMIVLSGGYAALLDRASLGRGEPAAVLAGVAGWLLAVHLGGQIGFTSGLHLHQRGGVFSRGLLPVLLGAVLGVVVLSLSSRLLPSDQGSVLPWGIDAPAERAYRLVLLCYGTLLPGYVWLCMIPSARAVSWRHRWLTWAVASAAAYAAGVGALLFDAWWLVAVIVGVLLIARAFIGWPSGWPAPSPAD